MTAALKRTVTDKMDAAREDEARKLLEWNRVLSVINGAAGAGRSQVALVPPPGINLKAAPTALATISKLTDAGFVTLWQSRRESPEAEEFFALLVSW